VKRESGDEEPDRCSATETAYTPSHSSVDGVQPNVTVPPGSPAAQLSGPLDGGLVSESGRTVTQAAAVRAPPTSVTGMPSTWDIGVPEGGPDSACCRSEPSLKRP
jgi:hypothetical protein